MSATIHSQKPQDSQTQNSKPLDEAVWRAWLKKNLFEKGRRAAVRIKDVNWACIGVLLFDRRESEPSALPAMVKLHLTARWQQGRLHL